MSNPHLDTRRHMELFDPDTFNTPVTIIGAGATGSWLALQLAKLGITDITVWDFDVIEEHNIPNQLFGVGAIGDLKAHAVQQLIKRDTRCEIKIHNEPYTNQRLSGIVFCMVDSMETRQQIWNDAIKMKSAISLYIEPRMGLDVARVYNVVPTDLNHIKEYEDTFYSDDEAEVSACGTSMTVITSAVATASWCARQLINFHQGEEPLDNEILIDYKFNNIIPTRWGV